MALSTATVMRTITSVMVIASTVVQPPSEAVTTTITPEQTTVISASVEKPVTDSSFSISESIPAPSTTPNVQNTSSVLPPVDSASISQPIQSPSSVPTPPVLLSSSSLSIIDTPNSGQFAVSTAAPNPNTPVFDRLHTTTSVSDPTTPVFDKEPIATSTVNPNTPVFDKQHTTTSVPDPNTPLFDKPLSTSSTPAQDTPVFDKPLSTSSTPAQTSVFEQPAASSTSTQESSTSSTSEVTSQQVTSEPISQSTQQSSPETPSSVTSHSVEKAILLPPSTSSSQTSTAISSSESSSVLSSTFQTSVISTAATSLETTQSSDRTTTSDEITDPQTTYTTATLPGGVVTTISLDATAANETSVPSDTDVPIVGDANSNSGDEKTPIIVGGIIGGIAALSAIVILIWFLKRKVSRHRRSTLLTPLSVAPGTGGGGRRKYQINTASLGPTPRTTKLAAAITHYPKKLSEKMSYMPTNNESPGVNMNRGNSQFEPLATHSRHGSVDPSGDTHSERLRGWWSRAIQDASTDDLTQHQIPEKPHYADHPYFATTDSDTQRRRMSRPTSVSSWTSEVPSLNPFTDANSVSGRGGMSTFLEDPEAESEGNPFADDNSITPPAVAQMAPVGNIQQVQRSRPQTVTREPSSRLMPRSGTLDVVSFYRDSAITDASNSFETRRNKIHSNPFDLEIDGSHPSAVPPPLHPVPGAYYDMSRPDTVRTRGDSFTSRYTSGTGWNRSTMGAVSSRWGSTVGYVPIGHVRSESDGSVRGPPGGQGVGQAM